MGHGVGELEILGQYELAGQGKGTLTPEAGQKKPAETHSANTLQTGSNQC